MLEALWTSRPPNGDGGGVAIIISVAVEAQWFSANAMIMMAKLSQVCGSKKNV